MSELPQISGLDAVRAFGKAGFNIARQAGSHVILKKEGHRYLLSVPLHKSLKTGTLRRLIRDAELTVEEFRRLL